ncbi:glycerophosphodiester phosphodiesterase family protein [Hirschia litorea]|uniref:glycerophosphodiester phosphodiesterase n=1 Tax=Hirschia litorea TaxID=1199156 RepID=A0ABW2INE4_9PROT
MSDIKTSDYKTLNKEKPIVIAHRGASGLYPEHTIKAYETAIEQGADFIEPDLVMTSDGVLIISHDSYLSATTNIADHPEFADRKTSRETPLGVQEDWWVDDFTLEEIKTLKARQAFKGRSKAHDDIYDIVTFEEIMDLAIHHANKGRIVGLHIEAKWPNYFASIGHDMVDPLLNGIEKKQLQKLGIPVFIQCFEPSFLNKVSQKSDLPLIQNIAIEKTAKPMGWDIKIEDTTTTGLGIYKELVLNSDGSTSDYVARAHAAGLVVHVYTLRDDAVMEGYSSVEDELIALFNAGVDGVWADFPATALKVRDAL